MKAPQGARTPAVLDELIDVFTAAAVDGQLLAKVQVIDGPSVVDVTDDVLVVAPSEDPEDEAVAVVRVPQPSLGKHVYVEQTHVTMVISAFTGDTDMRVRRARAREIFDAVKTLVEDRRVVAGKWDNLYLGESESWYQVQHQDGAIVAIGFTIVAEAIV